MTTTTSTGLEEHQQQQPHQLVALPPLHPASFDKLDPNRKDQVFLYYEKDVKKASTDGNNNSNYYRYKLTIIDRSISTTTNKLAYATAVFLIPAGREAEYIFSSIRGLQNIAESASTARLVAVSFGRNHVFASQQAVQEELTFVVQILSRQGSFLSKHISLSSSSIISNDIPFMALDGIGQRNVIAQGTSAASGPYLVEQVTVDDDRQVRRLYFMNNPFVIQTEVFLLLHNHETDNSNNGSNRTLALRVDKSRAAFDYHKIMAAGIMALSSSSSSSQPVASDDDDISSTQSTSSRGLLIGLGGGGLVNYMSHVWPPTTCTLTAIELDPTMVDIATKYFGLLPIIQKKKKHQANDGTTSLMDSSTENGVNLDVRIGNGLDITVARDEDNETNASTIVAIDDVNDRKQDAAAVDADASPSELAFVPGTMSFIVIDVDSKDNSKGMSCPPQSFIEVDYLERLSQLLLVNNNNDHDNGTDNVGGGVLAINVSARDPEMLQLVCRNVNQVFNTVILSSNDKATGANTEESSEDVNVVVFAKKSSQNDNNNDILSNRNLLTDRLVTLLQRNPNINEECMSDLKSTIQDFSMWNNNNDDDNNKSQQRVKKAGGTVGGGKEKSNKKKNKRGGKKK